MTAAKLRTSKAGTAGFRIRVGLLLAVACLFAGLTSPLRANTPPRLYVFLSADMRAIALEKKIEEQLPGVEVTVFGRIRGFEAALAERPDGVIAQRQVLEAFGLKPSLQGYLGNAKDEPYYVVSSKQALSPEQLNGKNVGAVNILGRKYMNDFVRGLLGGADAKIKFVTHERDLLALLQFGSVDAVLTSGTWAERFRSKSEMDIVTRPTIGRVGLPAAAFPAGSASGLEAKLKAGSPALNDVLGVNSWR